DNITINGGGVHVSLYIPVRVTITRCTFNNPSGTGDIIYAYYGTDDHFINNTFNCPSMDIDLDYTSTIHFTRNKGSINSYDHYKWRYSNFANNTFNVTSVRLYSGYFSDIQGNDLIGVDPSDHVIRVADCNRIKIANNTIEGGKNGMFIYHPNSYSPVRTYYPSWASLRIEDNIINGSADNGIWFYWVTDNPSMKYFKVFNNTISNCTNFGMKVRNGGNPTSVIWRNIFRFNHGSGTTYSTGRSQAEDLYGQMSWNNETIGNHWRDLTYPDDNSDGIVDGAGYGIQSAVGEKDRMPVTNPYFDLTRPDIRIISPSGKYQKHSYLNLSWEASDDLSGVKKVEVREGLSPWINLTGYNNYGLYLVQGSYWLKFKVTDRGNLYRIVEMSITVNETRKPFTIMDPGKDHYYNSTSIPVSWSLTREFVPSELMISLDGNDQEEKDPVDPFVLTAGEGEHGLEFSFTDHYGNIITETIHFTVDISEPDVEILSPAQGSVISNDLVIFEWDVSDNFGIDRIMTRIDQGETSEKAGNGFSVLLSEGAHTLIMEVFDLAGNSEKDSLAFVISRNTSLNIISPIFDRPTSSTEFTVAWEYLVYNLVISNIEIMIDNEAPTTLPLDSTSHTITIPQEGWHTISVRAKDIAGNTVSDSIEITIDRTSPSPAFIYPQDGVYLNSSSIGLEWSSIEKYGLDHYELYIDDQLRDNSLKQGRYNVQLEEGEHEIRVIAYDLAGNTGMRTIDVTIDLQRP
ncbi:MAG: hypothetical protein U9R75_09435, partial [Candidatus Thermoplasmatota archaeon]|nr:hypothetical protein [Candidatus Thermoplasmatota archaeon]